METIKFKDLELPVLDYIFNDDDLGKEINFKTELSLQDFEKIKTIKKTGKEYFIVEFKGQKINMRLGRPYWDLVNDKYIAHIDLFDDIYDKNTEDDIGKGIDFELLDENFMIKNVSLLHELINVLKSKKILNNDELKELYDTAKRNEFDRKYESFRVKDLDRYRLQ